MSIPIEINLRDHLPIRRDIREWLQEQDWKVDVERVQNAVIGEGDAVGILRTICSDFLSDTPSNDRVKPHELKIRAALNLLDTVRKAQR